jgi:hypothetical protein
VATGPAKLGQIVVTGTPFSSSSAAGPKGAAAVSGQRKHTASINATKTAAAANGSRAAADAEGDSHTVEGSVSDSGQIQGVALPVLDQLGGQVANDVAEQLSVQAVADFGNCTACQLGGISKVLPVNGTAKFDQLQLLARPGSNQSITFKLLSATEGVELPGSRQVVRVQLPSCRWGQATTAVGCYNCTSPLFSFSYSSSKCSICPDNAAYCSGTSLLPDSGYWNSGPLSTRMHKCPRRIACLRCVCVQSKQFEVVVCFYIVEWSGTVPQLLSCSCAVGCIRALLLLPDSGYWNSGPLSTRMHKRPRRNACLRWGTYRRRVANSCGVDLQRHVVVLAVRVRSAAAWQWAQGLCLTGCTSAGADIAVCCCVQKP